MSIYYLYNKSNLIKTQNPLLNKLRTHTHTPLFYRGLTPLSQHQIHLKTVKDKMLFVITSSQHYIGSPNQ